MGNTYTYSGPGTRWVVGDATEKGKLDISRINGDHLHEALNYLMDTDNPENGLLSTVEAPLVAPGGWVKGKDVPAKTSENISKVILVDLTDPGTMWDVGAFLARVRWTSWYQELGAPPMRGALWIDNAGTAVEWWNLDTDATYMTFTSGVNNMVSAAPGSLVFLDGMLYVGDTASGIVLIDFMRDKQNVHQTGGLYQHNGDVSERNDSKSAVLFNSSIAIKNNAVKSVAAWRDPTLVDEFGRPQHWWSAGHTTGISVYNVIDDAIYDAADAQDAYAQATTPGGSLFITQQFDPSDPDQVVFYETIEQATADSFVQTTNHTPSAAQNTGCKSLSFFGASSTWFPESVGAYEFGAAGGPIAVVGSDVGLLFIHEHISSYPDGGLILATSSYQTPYMKGVRAGAWPLNDVNDRSGNGYTLTNNGSVTFTSGPFGNTATFNGSSQYFSATTTAEVFTSDDIVVSFYFKTTTATNPSGTEYLLRWENGAQMINITMSTSAFIAVDVRDSASNMDTATTPFDVADAKWHHFCFVRDYSAGTHTIYLDGVEVASDISIAATSTVSLTTLYLGYGGSSGHFDGQIAQVFVGHDAWTEAEIRLEYQRMVRGLGGATHTLTADDVDSVRIDPNTGIAAVCVGDRVEIWDVVTGLRESIDATTTATLNDADVRQPADADGPWYIAGRSGQFEIIAPDRRILG